jgi:hypothetical protein
MCGTSGSHVIDRDTEILSTRAAFVPCRSCLEPSWVIITEKRRLACLWTSVGKCDGCYD